MLRNRLLPASVVLAFAACSQPDSALRVDLSSDESTPFATDCLRLTVLGADGNPLMDGSATFAEPANQKAKVVIRRQETWPKEVTLRIEGLVGPALPSNLTAEERPAAEAKRCAEAATLRLNARSDKPNQNFPTSGITDVELVLKRDAAKDVDADDDGFASVVGTDPTRADCEDMAAHTHYGQAQLCTTTADTDCNDLPGCDDPVCFGIGLCNAPPTQLVLVDGGFIDNLATAQPSYTRIPLLYELRNAQGQPRSAIRNTPVTFTVDNPNVELLGGQADGGFIIPVNTSQLQVAVRANVSLLETVNVQLSAVVNAAPDAGLVTNTTVVRFEPAPVTQLGFVDAGVVTVAAAACSAQTLRLQLQDANNRPTLAPASGRTVTFAVPGTINQGAVFEDANCTVPLMSHAFAPGESEISMHVGYGTYGAYEVTADSAGLPTARYPFRVNAGGAARLGFFSSTGAVTTLALGTGDCSFDGQLFIGLLDAQGNPTTSTTDTPLTLTLSANAPADLGFFTSACTSGTQTLNFTLPANAISLPLHVRGTTATAGDVTATMSTTASGVASTSVNVSIGAGPASTVELAGTGQTITAGSCSTTPFTVRLKDLNGNSVGSDAGVLVTLSNDADLTFFTDGGCSPSGVNSVYLPAGAPEQLVTFRGTAARVFTLGGGTGVSSVPVLNPVGSVTNNVIQPAAASSVQLAPTTLSINAGDGCGQLTATVLDAFGNPTPFGLGGPAGGTTARALVLNQPNLKVSSDSLCGTNGATLNAGESSMPLFLSSTVASTYATTVTPNGLPFASNPSSVTVNAGPATFLIRDAGTPWPITAGECRTVVVSNEDTYGNAVPITTLVTVNGGAGTQLFTDGTCLTTLPGDSFNMAGVSSGQFGVKPTRAGDRQVTANSSAPLTLQVRPAGTHHYAFEGAFAPVLTAGDCAGPMTLARYDVWNNLTDGGAENNVNVFSNPASRVSYYPGAGCSGAPFSVTSFPGGATNTSSFFVGATVAGNVAMLASSGFGSGDAGLTVVADAGHHLSFVTQPASSLTAGACAPFTVEQRDGFNNQVAGNVTVNLSSDAVLADGGTGVFFTSPAGTCTAQTGTVALTTGSPQGTFNFHPEKAANVMVSANSTGLVAASANFVVQPGAPTVLAWQQLPVASVQRFACASAGIAEARDGYGNVATVGTGASVAWSSSSGLAAAFFGDSSCTSAANASILSNGSATGEVFFKASGTTGTITATATSSSLNGASTPAQSVTVSGTFGQLAMTPEDAPVEAAACVPFVVSRSDATGAAVTYGTTDFTASVGAGVTLHPDAACNSGGAVSMGGSILPGVSQQTIYVRGHSVDDLTNVTVTVTAGGFDAGTANAAALPLVRRGRCDLDNAASVRCELSPAVPNNDVSRSFMFFSSTGGDSNASNSNVACRLDSSGDAAVVCARSGSGTGDGGVLIEYQVVSYGRGWDAGGVSVQHLFDGGLSALNADVPYLWTPSLSDSFVLFSNWSMGSENSGDDFMTAQLTSGGVHLESAPGGANKLYSLEVVSFSGASVQRGEVIIAAGSQSGSVNSNNPGANTANSFLLYSVRGADDAADAGSAYRMCKRQVRGSLGGSAPMTASFNRGIAEPGCIDDPITLSWEIVTLPAATATTATLASLQLPGSTTGPYVNQGAAISNTPNKSVAFAGGQGPGGQAGGESNFLQIDNSGDQTGPFHALLHLTASNVTVMCRNPGNTKTSAFSPQVIQFTP